MNFLFIAYYSNLINNQQNTEGVEVKNDFNRIYRNEDILKMWNTTWGGSEKEFSRGITSDSIGNIYIIGSTDSYGAGNKDIMLIKFFPNGSRAWNVTWGGPDDDEGYGICLDSVGNIYTIGRTLSYGMGNYDFSVVKFYPNGIMAWNITWGGSDLDDGYGIALDLSGNIYTVGRSKSYGSGYEDIVIVKFHQNGTRLWNKTWGLSQYEKGEGIMLDSAGNIHIVGYTERVPGEFEFVIIKYDPNGIMIWNRTWGGNDDDIGYDLTLDSGGNVYTVGYTRSYGNGNEDFAIVKFHSNGTKAWNTTWGGSSTDICNGITQDSAGNIYMVGTTLSFGAKIADLALVKFSSNGTKSWNTTWGGSEFDNGMDIMLESVGKIYAVGETYSYGVGNKDIVVINYYNSNLPQSNHPRDKILNQYTSDSIDWFLMDDIGLGYYKILINNTACNWQAWNNNWDINYPINTSTTGVFNYTIQFNDSDGNWGMDTVIITIINNAPYSNHPQDLELYKDSSRSIGWVLTDEIGSGYYRVFINDIAGIWIEWANNSDIQYPIDTSSAEIFNFTIQFNDSDGNLGDPDTVIVIIESIPYCNHPQDMVLHQNTSDSIDWVLTDEIGSGYYRVFINGIPKPWQIWTNNSNINYPIDTSSTGEFNYTIQYNDSMGNLGNSDTVIVTIYNVDIIYPIIFVIIIVGSVFAILTIVIFNNLRKLKVKKAKTKYNLF